MNKKIICILTIFIIFLTMFVPSDITASKKLTEEKNNSMNSYLIIKAADTGNKNSAVVTLESSELVATESDLDVLRTAVDNLKDPTEQAKVEEIIKFIENNGGITEEELNNIVSDLSTSTSGRIYAKDCNGYIGVVCLGRTHMLGVRCPWNFYIKSGGQIQVDDIWRNGPWTVHVDVYIGYASWSGDPFRPYIFKLQGYGFGISEKEGIPSYSDDNQKSISKNHFALRFPFISILHKLKTLQS